MRLKQFIPQKYCLKCDVCCRFNEKHTVWAPLFLISEIRHLVNKNIVPPLLFTYSRPASVAKNKAKGVRINLIKHNDYFICPCFEPSSHSCKIYKHRPFECRLYPFLLVKKDDKLFLAQDKRCPYLNIDKDDKIKTYIAYLEKELSQKNFRSFLSKNRELFTPLEAHTKGAAATSGDLLLTGLVEYPFSDLKILFPLNLD